MSNELMPESSNFIREAIEEDLRTGRFDRVQTRFPPEPNGYLHIGHTKALVIDFGTAGHNDDYEPKTIEDMKASY